MARQECGAGLATWTEKEGPALCYGADVTEEVMTQLTDMKASTYVSQWSEGHLHGSLVPPGSPTTSQQGCCKDTGQRPPSPAASQPGSPYWARWFAQLQLLAKLAVLLVGRL